jgi:protein-S-isoprenylcysteine O-methyltransferase
LRPLPFSAGLPYELSFWCAFALWIVFEVANSRTRKSDDPSRVRDRGSLRLIGLLWLTGIGADFWLSFLLPQASILHARRVAFWLGFAFMLAGIALRLYSIAILGRFFTFDVAIHSTHTLVEKGPYRYVGHPSYSGALVTLLGFGLALGNWAGLAAGLSCMAVAYTYRITIEEDALSAALGERYTQYVHRTWRLVPFVF